MKKSDMSMYPPRVYVGITDEEDTWGICCSKEAARKCAEKYYDRYVRIRPRHIPIIVLLALIELFFHAFGAFTLFLIPSAVFWNWSPTPVTAVLVLVGCVAWITRDIRELYDRWTYDMDDWIDIGKPLGILIGCSVLIFMLIR